MKKFILTAFLLVILTGVASQAQSKYAGVRAGANFSTTDPDDFGYKHKVGFHWGAFYHLGISEKIGFQPELLFSTKGFRLERDVIITNEVGEEINRNGKVKVTVVFSYYLDHQWVLLLAQFGNMKSLLIILSKKIRIMAYKV